MRHLPRMHCNWDPEKTGFGGRHIPYLHINGSNTNLPRVFGDLRTTSAAVSSLEDTDSGKTPVSQRVVTMSEIRGPRHTENKAKAEVDSDMRHGGQRAQVLPSRL